MKRLIGISRRAARQLAAASAWWHENRPAAPLMFDTELRLALAALEEIADVHAFVDPVGLPGVRRVLLARVRYHLYYRLKNDGSVDIVACWHTSRGASPLARDK